MPRLNIERQNKLEPKRMAYAHERLTTLTEVDIIETTDKRIVFKFKGEKVTLYPYSGYFNGKSVRAGRGIDYLLDQLRK
jgi:hypothetical protein